MNYPSGLENLGHPPPWRLWVLLLLPAMFCLSASAQQEQPPVRILKLEGEIGQVEYEGVRRHIEQARSDGVEVFILELDTPGGVLKPSMDLGDFIFRQDEVDVIAYVHNQAFSGGTMIALACEAIYIDATMGKMGDVAPVDMTGRIGGEKVQSVVRETMLSYARARGYPEALVKAMVTKELEVFRIQTVEDPEGAFSYVTGQELDTWAPERRQSIVTKELVVPAGELLTMSAERAVKLGFARKAVRSPQELYDVLEIDPARVERVYLSTSEHVLYFLNALSPLLIIAGLVLIFMELAHPGFGLPGILGVSCFALFFLVKVSLQYAHLLEILLFAAGVVLLLLEVFVIPGFGIAGVSGLVLIFVALVLSLQQFGWPRTPSETAAFRINLVKVMGSLVASGVGISLIVRLMPSMPGLRRVVNSYTLAEARVGEMQERRTPGVADMVGKVGVALTALRPAGRAEFDDKLLDVVTEGEFIDKGEPVRIQQVRGNRIVVESHREV